MPRFRASIAVAILLAGAGFVAFRWLGNQNATYWQLLSYRSAGEGQIDLGQLDDIADAQPVPGDSLLADSADRLVQIPAMECRIRQRVNLFGQQLTGVGHYSQWSPQDSQRLRLRWELKFQVGERVSSLQQINDGRFFWTRRDLPGEQSLSRIDLRIVRDVLERETQLPPEVAMRSWLVLGGLSRLVHGLRENFDFGLAQPRIVETTPVWVLVGSWKPARLAALVPNLQPQLDAARPIPLDQLPAHLPDVAVVVLSRDPRLPSFPYRVEYRRSLRGNVRGTSPETADTRWNGDSETDVNAQDGLNGTSEVAVIDLFEVNLNADLEPQNFAYQPPGSQPVVDETESFLLQVIAPSRGSGE
ncbi:MAG: hypothetical protein U0935_01290 [Pirellulales bacterium]